MLQMYQAAVYRFLVRKRLKLFCWLPGIRLFLENPADTG
jgi:hypothetical protein